MVDENLLMDRAARAFDYLIIDHGYRYEFLSERLDRMQKTATESQVCRYFITAWKRARSMKIKLRRETSNEEELRKYYTEEMAEDVLQEIAKSREKCRRESEDRRRRKEREGRA